MRQQTASHDTSTSSEGNGFDSDAESTEEDRTEKSDGAESETTTEEEEVEPLPVDQVFELLKNSRRRQTLRYLFQNGGSATTGELAEHIAALENDTSVKAISSQQRKRVYVGLYQCHLPKMDDMGVIEFEKNRGTVELGANVSQVEPYLKDTSEEEYAVNWARLYTGIAATGIGLTALSVLWSAPLGLSPLFVLIALLAIMSVCSALHLYRTRDS